MLEHLNALNLSEDHYVYIFWIEGKIEALIKELRLPTKRIENNSLLNFPTLQGFFESVEKELPE